VPVARGGEEKKTGKKGRREKKKEKKKGKKPFARARGVRALRG